MLQYMQIMKPDTSPLMKLWQTIQFGQQISYFGGALSGKKKKKQHRKSAAQKTFFFLCQEKWTVNI